MEHDVFAVYTGPKSIKTIGVVSGAGKPYAAEQAEMEEKGVELYISGETSESIPNKMKEAGINYFTYYLELMYCYHIFFYSILISTIN